MYVDVHVCACMYAWMHACVDGDMYVYYSICDPYTVYVYIVCMYVCIDLRHLRMFVCTHVCMQGEHVCKVSTLCPCIHTPLARESMCLKNRVVHPVKPKYTLNMYLEP